MNDDIMVSILCTAYNHERYIRKCLDGFIMQKATFDYEVLINDDASTDATARIIEEYSKKYPSIIKPTYQMENQYSKGIRINKDILFPKARGKYIALCEGDDFWIDEYKLEKQINYLEQNPDSHFCVCRVGIVQEDGKELQRYLPKQDLSSGLMSSRDFQKICLQETFQTSGFVMRQETMSKYYNEAYSSFAADCLVGDIPYRLYFGTIGPVCYISDVMSCYREGSISSVSKLLEDTIQKKIKMHENMIEMYKKFDGFSKYEYTDICEKRILKNQFGILYCKGEFRRLLLPKYKEIFKNMSTKRKADIILSCLFPKFTNWLKKKVFGVSIIGL